MKMRDRQLFHMEQAQTALGLAIDREGHIAAMHRVEAAIHELATTFAAANQTEVENAAVHEEQAASLRMFKTVLQQYQDAITKAHQGLSPWGEIKLVGEQLQQAIQRLENCGL